GNVKTTTHFLTSTTPNSNCLPCINCILMVMSDIHRQIAMIIVFSSMNTIPMDNLSISMWVDSKSLLLGILWYVFLHANFVNPPANKGMLQGTMRRVGKLVIHLWTTLFLLVNLIFLHCICAIAIQLLFIQVLLNLFSVQIFHVLISI